MDGDVCCAGIVKLVLTAQDGRAIPRVDLSRFQTKAIAHEFGDHRRGQVVSNPNGIGEQSAELVDVVGDEVASTGRSVEEMNRAVRLILDERVSDG